MYIFLDESGEFEKHNKERYFVAGSFTVGDPRRTEKQFRSWQHKKFPRVSKSLSEIKFSGVKIEDKLRLNTIKFISRLDVRIHYTYLLRENIPDSYWKKDILQSGLLYSNVIGETLDMYFPSDENEVRIFCDRRHLKGMSNAEFCALLKARILPQLSPKAIVQIEMIDSTANANIQIADWIVGALAAYLEHKPLGEKFFKSLRNNLLEIEGK